MVLADLKIHEIILQAPGPMQGLLQIPTNNSGLAQCLGTRTSLCNKNQTQSVGSAHTIQCINTNIECQSSFKEV